MVLKSIVFCYIWAFSKFYIDKVIKMSRSTFLLIIIDTM